MSEVVNRKAWSELKQNAIEIIVSTLHSGGAFHMRSMRWDASNLTMSVNPTNSYQPGVPHKSHNSQSFPKTRSFVWWRLPASYCDFLRVLYLFIYVLLSGFSWEKGESYVQLPSAGKFLVEPEQPYIFVIVNVYYFNIWMSSLYI